MTVGSQTKATLVSHRIPTSSSTLALTACVLVVCAQEDKGSIEPSRRVPTATACRLRTLTLYAARTSHLDVAWHSTLNLIHSPLLVPNAQLLSTATLGPAACPFHVLVNPRACCESDWHVQSALCREHLIFARLSWSNISSLYRDDEDVACCFSLDGLWLCLRCGLGCQVPDCSCASCTVHDHARRASMCDHCGMSDIVFLLSLDSTFTKTKTPVCVSHM